MIGRFNIFRRAPSARSRLEKVGVDKTYKVTEVVGSSSISIEDAMRSGVERASKTLRNLDWFEVTDIRGSFANGSIAYFR